MKRDRQVKNVIWDTIKRRKWLSGAIVCTVVGAVLILLYFGMLALTGLMESAREGLLIVFGQKITHALRSSLMEKLGRLSADQVNRQEPGTLVSRFVGDVDTVENLFTSGIISMFADACKIVSILAVIWFRNRGLSLILLLLMPFLFGFTRQVQKKMLKAQIENRQAVGRASAHVPETLHNIRTIHCLGKESYMEEKYDQYIGESYQAMEKTNFYDAIYSGGRRGDAAVRLGECAGAGAVWHVSGHVGGYYQLHLPDFYSYRKPGHGDSDHPVRRCRCTPD